MNFKNSLPWIFVLILAVGTGILFTSVQSKEEALAQLRQENAELPELRSAVERAGKAPANPDATVTGKEREELIRLRNEVGVLRREKQQLATQFQQAQKSQERLENQQAQQAQLLQQNQQLAQVTQEQQNIQARIACINNLRQIDGAKQQWALENKQPADALAIYQQIAPYLKDQAVPSCPSGGTYTLNAVSSPPACSIPGHALK